MLKKPILFFPALCLLCLASATAAEFGKNKVQYFPLHWRYISTPHFYIYYHQDQNELPRTCARWAEEIYASLGATFKFKHRQRIPLILYGNPNLFQQTNVIMELIPEGVGGFTELFKNRVVLPFSGSYQELRHVLHHELVHAFEFGILYDEFAGVMLRNAGQQMPLWFAEGLAEYLSNEWDAEADMFLMDQAVYGELPSADLDMGGSMAYKGGQSFLTYLAQSRGQKRFDRFLQSFKEIKNVEAALERAFGAPSQKLAAQWSRELKRLYWPEIGKRDDPTSIARPITSNEKIRSHYNLRPRLSPDGAKIAFFSDRNDDTRIIIADRTGKTIREITQYGYGGYFESFHPSRSGLCWSPNGDRIAFVTTRGGRDELRIVRTDTWRMERTIRFDAPYLSSPDWSPDGATIVVCGLKDDASDLYLVKLTSGEISRLTTSAAYEADPRFAPDGSYLIFSAGDTLGPGPASLRRSSQTHLYSLDMETRSIQQLTYSKYNESQPCFASDGAHIVYISDRNGLNNLYLAPLSAPDSCRPLTNLIGGCFSPDWARNDSALVFSLFQKQAWHIWRMERPFAHAKDSALAPTQWRLTQEDTSLHLFAAAPDTATDTSALGVKAIADGSSSAPAHAAAVGAAETAPTDSIVLIGDSAISGAASPERASSHGPDSAADSGGAAASNAAKAKADTTNAAAAALRAPSLPYRLRFSPDLVAVGLAINTLYGSYGGQGVIVLSDVLGNHRITIAGDMQGRLDEYAHLYGSYLSLQHRLDFGAAAFFSRDYTIQSLAYIYHDTNIGGLLMASYPFSQEMRVGFDAYCSNLSRNVLDSPYARGGSSRGAEQRSLNHASYFIVLPKLSFVFDNIVWGITGPVNGIRANASILCAPPLPSTERQFIAGEIDFRKYFHFARRFVLAVRGAAGGSQPLGDEPSARRYFLGGNENWLFLHDDIHQDNYLASLPYTAYSAFVMPFRGWKLFGLTGTRFALANTEFRFPFIKNITVVWPIPFQLRYINGAVFIDAGNAWDPEEQMPYLPLPRDIYGGIGFGLRANLGIFLLRFDHAWRTDWKSFPQHPRSYFSLGADF